MAFVTDARVRIVNSREGDWQGIYIDGVLVDEGHSLDLKSCLEYVTHAGVGPNDIFQHHDVEIDACFPPSFEDLRL